MGGVGGVLHDTFCFAGASCKENIQDGGERGTNDFCSGVHCPLVVYSSVMNFRTTSNELTTLFIYFFLTSRCRRYHWDISDTYCSCMYLNTPHIPFLWKKENVYDNQYNKEQNTRKTTVLNYNHMPSTVTLKSPRGIVL